MTNANAAELMKAIDRCLNERATFKDGTTCARALKDILAGEPDGRDSVVDAARRWTYCNTNTTRNKLRKAVNALNIEPTPAPTTPAQVPTDEDYVAGSAGALGAMLDHLPREKWSSAIRGFLTGFAESARTRSEAATPRQGVDREAQRIIDLIQKQISDDYENEHNGRYSPVSKPAWQRDQLLKIITSGIVHAMPTRDALAQWFADGYMAPLYQSHYEMADALLAFMGEGK